MAPILNPKELPDRVDSPGTFFTFSWYKWPLAFFSSPHSQSSGVKQPQERTEKMGTHLGETCSPILLSRGLEQENPLNKKVAAVIPLPSPQQRHFRDCISHIPSFYLVNLPPSNMTKKKWMLTYVNCTLSCSPGMHAETSSYNTEKAYRGKPSHLETIKSEELHLQFRQKIAR